MSKKVLVITGIFMGLALLGLIILQAFWLGNATRDNEKQFDQDINKALLQATNRLQQDEHLGLIYNEFRQAGQLDSQDIKEKIDVYREINNRVIHSLFLAPPIEERISAEKVREYVDKALGNHGRKTHYEFAVTNEKGQIVIKSRRYDPESLNKHYITELFPGDVIEGSNHLILYFPDRQKLIIRSVGWMGLSSAFLVVFMIITFSFTLYVILKQKKLSDMKSDFVNNMTHELKTPISTISLASQMLSDKSITPEKKNYDRISAIILDETKRLGYQVERVLQMAKFDQDDLSLQFEEISLHEIIESVISNFALQVDAKNGVLIPSLHADRDLILGDPVHTANIVSNLLDNAVKYTTDSPEILIETRNISQFILMTVRDNGIGISKANQKRIFDKFYRVSTGNIHNVKGFGLGLSYVKRIVEEHHGSVSLESEPDVGTSFFVKLPLKKQEYE